jgi:hypothetical protein
MRPRQTSLSPAVAADRKARDICPAFLRGQHQVLLVEEEEEATVGEPISPKDAVRAFLEATCSEGYAGLFVNQYGERWVFTCTHEGEAKVTGQDVDWAVYPVTAPPAVGTLRPGPESDHRRRLDPGRGRGSLADRVLERHAPYGRALQERGRVAYGDP